MRDMDMLSPVSYRDTAKKISLECYADTLVFLKDQSSKRTLVAARLGGYPEQICGMCDAIGSGITMEATVEEHQIVIQTLQKQYHKTLTHDGVYAETVLVAKDDEDEEQIGTEDTDPGKKQDPKSKKRMFLFCPENDTDFLFSELDKKLSIPLIPEFKDYMLKELIQKKFLLPLIVLSASQKFEAYILEIRQDESDVVNIINAGLHTKQIAIPNANYTHDFSSINTVSEYLKCYGTDIASRIKDSFNPLFDPNTEIICTTLNQINAHLYQSVGYRLYPAQLAVAESVKRRLDKSKVAMIIAECGSGKTKIGACALAAHQEMQKSINVVLCPSHVTQKWAQEIEETLPDTTAAVIHSIEDVNTVYQNYLQGKKSVYMIISKERARDGYMKQPSVRYSPIKRRYLCPDCGAVIETELNDGGSKYLVTANQFFFLNETDKNHKCRECGTVLWTAINPSAVHAYKNEWIKIGYYGFVNRRFAEAHLHKSNLTPKVIDKLNEIVANPDEVYIAKGAYRRYTISGYINSKIKVNGLIADELHQFKGDSGQGNAMASLINCSDKVIGMTATLVNGYASGIFYLLYRVAPGLMLADHKPYDKPGEFNQEYGVTESVYQLDDADEMEYNANCRNKVRKLRDRLLPGVSPLVYSRFLLESAVFLSLNDMGKHLPEYEEIPICLQLNKAVREEYDRIEDSLRSTITRDRSIAKKLMSKYLNLLTTYPDQPYGAEPIYYPGGEIPIVAPKDMSNFNELHEKDTTVLDIVARKVKNGERVLLYTNWVKTDTQAKLQKLLTEHGYRTEILQSTIAPDKREQWVENKVQKGIDVLITNPSLVETGLDLNAFTTLIYYNIGYNLFTFRQSSRRSWRINQTAPRIEVYILFYEDVMQARAIKLMASKLSVATIIEGNLTDEGLAAMSDYRDMTAMLAKELTLGIKNKVDDIAESFKNMAILHDPADKEKPALSLLEKASEPIQSTVKNPEPVILRSTDKPLQPSTNPPAVAAISTAKKQKITVKYEQMSIFDVFAS